jgi:glycosyltransferase involved in cell wall biosynthesis
MKLEVISFFFPPNSTGAGTVTYNMFKYIPTDNYEVITISDSTSYKLGIYDSNYILNSKATKLPIYSISFKDRFLFFILSTIFGMHSFSKKKFNYVLVIYPYFTDLITGYILHKLTRRPLLIYMHDLFSETRKGARLFRFWEILETKILHSSKIIFVMNEKYISHYSKRGFNNIVLLPPSIDLSNNIYQTLREDDIPDDQELKIVFTGSAYGAHEDAIIKFIESAQNLDNIKLVFATPMYWGLTKKLKQMLKEISVGFLSKEACIQLQNSADILFLPLAFHSVYEEEIICAFPCKLLEYLAVGKPILALVPKGCFVESFINKYEVGVTVDELSTEKILTAINILKDEKTRIKFGDNAKKTVEMFDSKTQSQKFISFLNNLS